MDYENAGNDVQQLGYNQLKSDLGKTTVERVARAWGIRETTIQIVADSTSYEEFESITRLERQRPVVIDTKPSDSWRTSLSPKKVNQQYSTGVYVASFITLLVAFGLVVWLLVTIIQALSGGH
jgi:hypothetical protein